MDVRIAVIAGAVFLGVVTSGFLMSSAEADFASAITAPFRESEDEHDDDDWDSDDVIRTGVDDVAVFGADAQYGYGFAGDDWYARDDDDDHGDDDHGHDDHDDDEDEHGDDHDEDDD